MNTGTQSDDSKPQTLNSEFSLGWGYKGLALSLNSNFYDVCIFLKLVC